MKKNKVSLDAAIVCTFLLSLVLLAFPAFSLEKITYKFSASDSRADAISNANQTITMVESLGYNSQRLKDIMEEAESSANDADFFSVMAGFENTVERLNAVGMTADNEEKQISVLKQKGLAADNVSIIMGDAEGAIKEGRYEDADTILSYVSTEVNSSKFRLETFNNERLQSAKKSLANMSGDNSLLSSLESDMGSEGKRDIDSLILFSEELDELDSSLSGTVDIYNFSIYLERNNINSSEIDDGLSQIYFYLKARRYEKIATVLEGLKGISDAEGAARVSISNAETETYSFPESDKKNEFIIMLSDINKSYYSGDFSAAKHDAETLSMEIVSAKSDIIVQGSLGKNQFSILDFIKGNMPAILGMMMLVIALYLFLRKPIYTFALKKRIKYYESRKANLIGIMKNLQERYFVQKKMSKRAYSVQMRQNQMRYADITKDIMLMNDMLKK